MLDRYFTALELRKAASAPSILKETFIVYPQFELNYLLSLYYL